LVNPSSDVGKADIGGSVGELLLEGATVLDDETEGGRVGELLVEGTTVRVDDAAGVPVDDAGSSTRLAV